MKTQTLSQIMAVVLMLVATPCLAATGEKGGNGGDSCEKRIQEIRLDLEDWIRQGGAAELKLPSGVSLNQYQQLMLDGISRAVVSCQSEPIYVGSAEKTCKNIKDRNGTTKLTCNASRFMKETSESDQYVLIHHEYAGVAGLEVNQGERSDYTISNQLNGFLETVAVKKLSLHPTKPLLFPEQCSQLNHKAPVPVGTKCMTFSGAIYEKVQYENFGEAWKAPSGVIWSNVILSSVSKSNAPSICAQVGGRLPTIYEADAAAADHFLSAFSPNGGGPVNFGWCTIPRSGNSPSNVYHYRIDTGAGAAIIFPDQPGELNPVRCVAN